MKVFPLIPTFCMAHQTSQVKFLRLLLLYKYLICKEKEIFIATAIDHNKLHIFTDFILKF